MSIKSVKYSWNRISSCNYINLWKLLTFESNLKIKNLNNIKFWFWFMYIIWIPVKYFCKKFLYIVLIIDIIDFNSCDDLILNEKSVFDIIYRHIDIPNDNLIIFAFFLFNNSKREYLKSFN